MANLTWDDVREMQAAGARHRIAHRQPSRSGRHRAGRSTPRIGRFQKNAGRHAAAGPVRFLAYPFGGRNNFRPEYLPLARSLGYEACFSAYGGFVEPQLRGQILPREAMPYFRSLSHLGTVSIWLPRLVLSIQAASRGAVTLPRETNDIALNDCE